MTAVNEGNKIRSSSLDGSLTRRLKEDNFRRKVNVRKMATVRGKQISSVKRNTFRGYFRFLRKTPKYLIRVSLLQENNLSKQEPITRVQPPYEMSVPLSEPCPVSFDI